MNEGWRRAEGVDPQGLASRTVARTIRSGIDSHLTRAGVKQSWQRNALENVFLSGRGHETPDELGAHVRPLGIDVTPAMLERAMELMAGWSAASLPHFHGVPIGCADAGRVRLICETCGSVEEFTHTELVAAERSAAREHAFALEAGVLDVRGRCSGCGARRANGRDC